MTLAASCCALSALGTALGCAEVEEEALVAAPAAPAVGEGEEEDERDEGDERRPPALWATHCGPPGALLTTVTGHYFPYDHLPGGYMLVPLGPAGATKAKVTDFTKAPITLR
jgi:hypothetical protein